MASTDAAVEPPPRRGRGRRPSAQVRAEVLHTVGELLLSEGMADFTIERVARLSGVSKTTIYKWWPTKGALALDGYFHAVKPALEFPDTGDVRADITTQFTSFVHIMSETPAGKLLAQLIGESQTDDELGRAYRALYSSGRRQLAADRLRAAQEAGQIRSDVDVRTVIDQLWGAVYHRILIPDEPVDREFGLALIANLFEGITEPQGDVPR